MPLRFGVCVCVCVGGGDPAQVRARVPLEVPGWRVEKSIDELVYVHTLAAVAGVI